MDNYNDEHFKKMEKAFNQFFGIGGLTPINPFEKPEKVISLRPDRETIISKDEILNLSIDLNTTVDSNMFINSI